MNSFFFPSPNQNYSAIWRPLPTKLISGGQTNIANSNVTPILMKSPLAFDEINFRSAYLEKSEITNKEGLIMSKRDYNNPHTLPFEQIMNLQTTTQPKILIKQNYFENGSNDQPNQFGTYLFSTNPVTEELISKSAEKPMLINPDASSNTMSSVNQKKSIKSAPIKKTITFKTESTQSNNTHVMNFTNNFYFQFKSQSQTNDLKVNTPIFLKKKRTSEKSWNTKAKKLKKKDKTTKTYLLNQISIDNISIAKFPMINLQEEDLSVQLLTRMIATGNYFDIVDKYYSNIPGIDEEMINNKTFIKQFNKEKSKINSNLYLIENNKNETLPQNLLKNFYRQIKETVKTIEKNYIGKRRNSLNDFECDKLKKLIQSCNDVSDIMTDFKKSGIRNKRSSKIRKKQQHYKTYLCPFCNKAYSNGQGLGGHISRIHHNQSEKYQEKMRIRNRRVDKRQRIYEIKKDLFSRYGINIDDHKSDKKFISNFVKEHNQEYQKIRKEIQKEDKRKIKLIQVKDGLFQNVFNLTNNNECCNEEKDQNVDGNLNRVSESDESSINEEAVRILETTKGDSIDNKISK